MRKLLKLITLTVLLLTMFANTVFGAVTPYGYFDQNTPTFTTVGTVASMNLTMDNNTSTSGFVGPNSATTINLPVPVTITKFYFDGTKTNNDMMIQFISSSGSTVAQILSTSLVIGENTFPNQSTAVTKIKYVHTGSTTSALFYIKEFELNPAQPIVYDEVTNLTNTSNSDSVTLSYSIPTANPNYTGSKIYRDGILIATQGTTATTYKDDNLMFDKSYTYRVKALYSDNTETPGITTTATTMKPPEISDLSFTKNATSVNLTWENANDNRVTGYKVYRDGELIKTLLPGISSYKDYPLNPSQEYLYKITTMYNEYETNGMTINTKTSSIPLDVLNLEVKKAHNKVTLTWELPEDDLFSKVVIFRDNAPIGEVTGTSFIDNTVVPETSYEYKIMTLSTEESYSEGIIKVVETPEEPIPVIEGLEFQKELNGDYTVTWNEPTTGQIKILIGGNDYKTVNSSLQSYTIPKGDLKYTGLGEPDIKLQPISESGKIGEVVNKPNENLNLPFSMDDLLKTGTGLLWLVAPFLLVALSLLLVPRFRKLIVEAFTWKKIRERSERRTRERSEREAREKTEKEARESSEVKEISEKETRERSEREARERAEKETRERSEREARERAEKETRERSERRTRERSERRTRERSERTREVREARVSRKARGERRGS